ncbi:hypothetical protein BGZ58_001997 [Dissophora ornata]|nr:hypothetical protein BGZ58_001997 [Dissophora ornata]
MPTANTDITQLDPETLASIPEVTYDLKRLKVYSSCLRCRAKKVKCDRKEPCSRCEKHKVECSYRELASVQLDIRQFQKHLTNPKIRKDGAGIITSTATPIIKLPSGDTAVLSPSTTAAATLIAAVRATALNSNAAGDNAIDGSGKGSCRRIQTNKRLAKNSSTSAPTSPVEIITPSRLTTESISISSSSGTDTESDTGTRAMSNKIMAMARAKVRKIHRQKRDIKTAKKESIEHQIQRQQVQADAVTDDESSDEEEEVERLVLRDDGDYGRYSRQSDVRMLSDDEEEEEEEDEDGHSYANVPIWRAQAVGKHKQTAHEQAMAETFGLAAYLKATEMDSGAADPTVTYDLELERALVQRMPTSFSRPDRSMTRARKYAQAGYNPALPYARPAHCQLSAISAAPVAAHCCCQIAAKHGQAPGTCYFSGNTSRQMSLEDSSVSPPPQTIGYEQGQALRIAYSPTYQPSYTPKEQLPGTTTATPTKIDWPSSASSMMPPPLLAPIRKLDIDTSSASSSSSPLPSPRIELPPIYLPKLPVAFPTTPASSDLSRFQVGRDGDKPLEIACKYNEPNVDAWDMIEKPLSRIVPVTTKRGRSVKMEMGWLLS